MSLTAPARSLAVLPDGGVLLGARVGVRRGPRDALGDIVLRPAPASGAAGGTFDWHLATVSALQPLDARRFLSASLDGTVALWEVGRPQPVRIVDGVTGATLPWVSSAGRGQSERELSGQARVAALSPDGRLLAVGDGQGLVRLWPLEGAHEVADLRGHEHQLLLCAFLPDGARLVTASTDGLLRVWDVVTGAVLRTIETPTPLLEAAALSRDGRRVALAGEDGVWLHDL